MANLVLVVNVTVDPEHTQALKPAMLENAANSVKEEGCLQFDVIQSQDDENSFLFYEVYTDADALASHRETPHFNKYWDMMQALGEGVRRTAQLHDQVS